MRLSDTDTLVLFTITTHIKACGMAVNPDHRISLLIEFCLLNTYLNILLFLTHPISLSSCLAMAMTENVSIQFCIFTEQLSFA